MEIALSLSPAKGNRFRPEAARELSWPANNCVLCSLNFTTLFTPSPTSGPPFYRRQDTVLRNSVISQLHPGEIWRITNFQFYFPHYLHSEDFRSSIRASVINVAIPLRRRLMDSCLSIGPRSTLSRSIYRLRGFSRATFVEHF